jgi:hypothetical protein
MSDVPTFLANLAAEFDAVTARDTTYLANALVRSLKRASAVRTLFMESSFTFMTTANQQDYPTGQLPGTTTYVGPTPAITPPSYYTIGVPIDFREMDSFYVLTGNAFGLPGVPINRGTIEQLRAAYLRYIFPGIYTGLWCFHHRAILLGPIPAGSQQLAGDYLRDAQRDSATGTLITASLILNTPALAVGLTNPWFNDGEFALRALVLMDYHRGLTKDAQQVDTHKEEWQEAIDIFSTEISQAKSSSMQAPRNFGEATVVDGMT